MKIIENNKNYITDKLFIYNNKLYYDKENRYIKINNSNWHKYLLDYGWTKLDLGWRNRLNNNNKTKHFKYGILDCGASGDCLFHSISEALNDPFHPENCVYDIKKLREVVADEVNDDNFTIILETYKLEKINSEFIGDWNPDKILTINDLKKAIKKNGDSFWGDHIILQLLQKSLKFNVIMLNSSDNLDKYTINPLASELKYDKTVIIYYIEGLHFQLVGYFDKNKMKTIFKSDELPKDLMEIYNVDCHII